MLDKNIKNITHKLDKALQDLKQAHDIFKKVDTPKYNTPGADKLKEILEKRDKLRAKNIYRQLKIREGLYESKEKKPQTKNNKEMIERMSKLIGD